jgi:hypothetical protein
MPAQASPQLRFLGRAVLIFLLLLTLWWLVLLDPMLLVLRGAGNFLIAALPGSNSAYGITVDGNRDWAIRMPLSTSLLRRWGAPAQFTEGPLPYRGIRLTLPRRIPNILTVGLPLFWSVILAAPFTRRTVRSLAAGSAILGILAPPLVLVCAMQVARGAVFPGSIGAAGYLIDLTAYLATAVIPCVVPVLLAVALHPELRNTILESVG